VDHDDLRHEVRDLVAQFGPLHLYEVAGYLDPAELPADLVDARGEVDLVRLDDVVWGIRDGEYVEVDWLPHRLADGSLYDIETAFAGMALTHVLGEDEVDGGYLELDPDLTALILAFDEEIPLSSPPGAFARIESRGGGEFGVVSDTPEWFPGEAGDVLAVAFDGWEVELYVVDAAVLDRDVSGDAGRLADVYDRIDEPIEIPELLAEVRSRYPSFLDRPSVPFGDLLEEAGLELRGDFVYRIGDPEDEDDDADDVSLAEHLRDDHGLDDQTIADLFLLDRELSAIVTAGLRRQMEAMADGQPDDQRAVVLDLAAGLEGPDPTLEPAAVLELMAGLMEDDQAVAALIEDFVGPSLPMAAVVAAAGRDLDRLVKNRIGSSNLRWAVARCFEIQGDTAQAERWLRNARSADPGHGGATFDLAGFLDDRGQAGAALGMLQELGATGAAPEWVETLRKFAQPGPATVGRNEPCGCGSGRKHKSCCGPANGWPLIERMAWLWDKVMRFATRSPQDEAVHELGHLVGPETGEAGAMAVLGTALGAGGLMEDFLEVRGPLLPADEREVVHVWAHVRAGLYEVAATEPGVSLELLDLRSGDRHLVTERSASSELAVGEAIVTWLHPYPDGTTRIGMGVIKVELRHREMWLDVFDADEVTATDILAAARRMWAPPALQNTDGEPLVMCTRVWRIPNPDGVRGALDAELEDAGDGTWLRNAETANSPMGTSVVATFRLEDDLLTIETNSVERLLRYAAEVEPHLGEALVIDEQRLPASDMIARARAGRSSGLLAGDDEWEDDDNDGAFDYEDLDPEAEAELDEVMTGYMEQYEEKWCDTPVPALGGMTPREAAADPTRRGDLEALLDEMDTGPEWTGPGRGMSAQRLRSLLRLE
jgi:hypothetical protein